MMVATKSFYRRGLALWVLFALACADAQAIESICPGGGSPILTCSFATISTLSRGG